MVVLVPGSPLSVIAMAVVTESAKLVTAGWLAAPRDRLDLAPGSRDGFGVVAHLI
jgi:hypothetical protein